MDEEWSKLPSLNTHRGFVNLERLLIGVKVTPAIFQHIIDTMFSGLEFAIEFILMNSQSSEQHKEHVYEVFKRIHDYEFKLKVGKCIFLWKKYILAKL